MRCNSTSKTNHSPNWYYFLIWLKLISSSIQINCEIFNYDLSEMSGEHQSFTALPSPTLNALLGAKIYLSNGWQSTRFGKIIANIKLFFYQLL